MSASNGWVGNGYGSLGGNSLGKLTGTVSPGTYQFQNGINATGAINLNNGKYNGGQIGAGYKFDNGASLTGSASFDSKGKSTGGMVGFKIPF